METPVLHRKKNMETPFLHKKKWKHLPFKKKHGNTFPSQKKHGNTFPSKKNMETPSLHKKNMETSFLHKNKHLPFINLQNMLESQRCFKFRGRNNNTVDGSEIRDPPDEVGNLSHYLEGFIHPKWCRISSINSIIWRFTPKNKSWGSTCIAKTWGIKCSKNRNQVDMYNDTYDIHNSNNTICVCAKIEIFRSTASHEFVASQVVNPHLNLPAGTSTSPTWKGSSETNFYEFGFRSSKCEFFN